MMRVLDLFSGIGGFSLGLERTGGFQTVAFCEIEPFCRRVLKKHWPEVPCYDDVRTLTAERLAADGIAVDAICGGFPCQDISLAGKGAGIEGERSSLWSEYARLIGEVRPRFVIVENVAVLLGRGLDRVLGDLAALGFDAEWHCVPASAVGAPHRRDRLWVVAYPALLQRDGIYGNTSVSVGAKSLPQSGNGRRSPNVAKSGGTRLSLPECETILGARRWEERRAATERGWWTSEPAVGRMAHGVPSRVDRLKALGNAVVPQIPELIGRAILEAHQ